MSAIRQDGEKVNKSRFGLITPISPPPKTFHGTDVSPHYDGSRRLSEQYQKINSRFESISHSDKFRLNSQLHSVDKAESKENHMQSVGLRARRK